MAWGALLVVATPLGNLQDITPRAVEALRRAAIVACEDTRRTRGLLSHFDIHPPRLISCHGFNETRQVETILRALREGRDVALVTDGGTPSVSDPGAMVVEAALREGLTVTPIPGPSAVAAAVSVCGFAATGFVFAGFLPPRAAPRRRALAELSSSPLPLVLFEAPHRIAAAAADMADVLGDREVTIVREATKLHEEVPRTTLSALAADLAGKDPARGEFTLVVAGLKNVTPGRRARADQSPAGAPAPADLTARYRALLAAGVDRREALRRLARETGLPRRAVYEAVAKASIDADGDG